MELAASAMSAIAGSVSSAVAGVGNAVGLLAAPGMGTLSVGLPSALSGGSLLSTILQGGATVAGIMGAMQQGDAQADNLTGRAADAELQAGAERVDGELRRDSLRRALLERFGEQDVQAAASGVDLSFGTPAIARQESARDAERALTRDQNAEDMRATRLMQRAGEFQSAARSARRAGVTKALGLGIGSAADILRRG